MGLIHELLPTVRIRALASRQASPRESLESVPDTFRLPPFAFRQCTAALLSAETSVDVVLSVTVDIESSKQEDADSSFGFFWHLKGMPTMRAGRREV
jgi:hypothetical protein